MNPAIQPFAKKLLSFAKADYSTNDYASSAFSVPKLSEYNFYLKILTMTGANQTQDFELQVTPDSGTTWLTVARFTQIVVATKTSYRCRFRPLMSLGDTGAAAEATTGVAGIVGTGALCANAALPGTTFRLRGLAGGTFTTFTAQLWLFGNHPNAEDNIAIQPFAKKVLSTFTAGANTAFQLPKLNEYNLYLNITAITSGATDGTVDVSLQCTPDGGTTWFTVARFTQITESSTSGVSQRLRFRPEMGPVETPAASDIVAITDGETEKTASALASNCALPGTTARFYVTLGGTATVAATGNIWLVGNVASMPPGRC